LFEVAVFLSQFDGRHGHERQIKFFNDLNFFADSLCVIIVFLIRDVLSVDQAESIPGRGVIGEHIEGVFAEMKPAFAQRDFSIVDVGFANLEFEPIAFQVLIKTLISDHFYRLLSPFRHQAQAGESPVFQFPPPLSPGEGKLKGRFSPNLPKAGSGWPSVRREDEAPDRRRSERPGPGWRLTG
jgi:hypothetical protein